MEQITRSATNKLLVPTISDFFIDAPQTDSGLYGSLPLLQGDSLNHDLQLPIPEIITKTEPAVAAVYCHRCGCRSRVPEDIFCFRCGVKLYKLFEFAEEPDVNEQLPLCLPSFCKRKREMSGTFVKNEPLSKKLKLWDKQFTDRRTQKQKRKRVSIYKNIFYGKQQECWMGNITYKGVIVRSCSKDEATAARILNTRCREKGIPIPNPHVGFASEQEARDKRKRGWRKRKQWDDIVVMQPFIGSENQPLTTKFDLPPTTPLDIVKTEESEVKNDFYLR